MSKIQKIYDYLKECNGFFFASCDGDKPACVLSAL